MDFSMMHPADQIVTIMERIYKYGMTTTSGGNLSVKDSEGVVWISPASVDKGTLQRDDIMKIMPDGTIVGRHKPSSEYPFHLATYRQRPDLKAVLHAHPPSLVAFSIARKIPDTTLLPNARQVCGDITMAPYALPGSQKLGENISEEFAKGINTVMLENHGVVIGAENLFKAFTIFETLDYCARLQINANSLGTPHSLTQKQYALYLQKHHPEMDEFIPARRSSEELEIRREMCALIKRAYDNELFTSGQGTFSRRLSDGSFIITPYAKDRKYLEPGDLVRIEGNKKEFGKMPSRSLRLHEEIYKMHDDINSVIIAHPPHIMAFAVTDARFNARLIPESYIMLRDIQKLPFGCSYLQPKETAEKISSKTPVVIIENDCVVAAGKSLLNAFDRLEVLEYSAKSVIDVKNIGGIVNISDDEVKEIETAFNLN
ncbi:MAG: class II aldolase/adducin family protein [Ruminococcaceae bacterium]|nr:class II aldolase/adducin family protein [Oscillospiraceae bacterium]